MRCLSTVIWLSLFAFDRAARTIVPCPPENCNITSLPRTGNERILGNRVSSDFSGYVDVRSNRQGTTFSADVQVLNGEAWPRISEGVAIPDANTPGYPVSLADYFKHDALYIKYRSEWRARTSGPLPISVAAGARGTLQSGAFMYLTAPDKYEPGSKAPIWPFIAEVNIWNRYDGLTLEHPPICDYTDSDGDYAVHGGTEPRGGNDTMRVYYVLKKANFTSSMNIDNVRLLRHLVARCKLSQTLDLLEVSIIAKGVGNGTDGQFYAEIESMGRIPDPDAIVAGNTNTNRTGASGKNNNNSSSNAGGDNGAKWEIIASIIGAIATLIAAILTVYLSQGKCRRRRNEDNHAQLDHLYDERPVNMERPANMDDHPRFEYV